MRGYNYNNVPTHTHDCRECKFLFGVVFHDNDEKQAVLDVYDQCGSHGDDRYLLRYSSEGADYASGVTLQLLTAGYFESRFPNLGKEVKDG